MGLHSSSVRRKQQQQQRQLRRFRLYHSSVEPATQPPSRCSSSGCGGFGRHAPAGCLAFLVGRRLRRATGYKLVRRHGANRRPRQRRSPRHSCRAPPAADAAQRSVERPALIGRARDARLRGGQAGHYRPAGGWTVPDRSRRRRLHSAPLTTTTAAAAETEHSAKQSDVGRETHCQLAEERDDDHNSCPRWTDGQRPAAASLVATNTMTAYRRPPAFHSPAITVKPTDAWR